MKILPFILLAAWPAALVAGPRSSANYQVLADTTDVGGRRVVSPNYTNDGSAGAIAGISTAPTAKHGYLGQLFDVTGLVVNAAATTVGETATLQLGARQLLDDATFLAVPATAVAWSVVSGPLTGISTAGVATAGPVYQDTAATVNGTFSGFTGVLNLSVLETIADNFGTYAGDGLADGWQIQYFGFDNPLAAPLLDPDGDGQTNAFEFTAGLVPTDPASLFRLRIERVAGEPGRKNINFSPRFEDRTYTVKATASLLLGDYLPLTDPSAPSDDGDERAITDLSATGAAKFYQVEIVKP